MGVAAQIHRKEGVMLYVLRQVLFGLGVFVGIAIKFAGIIVAMPAVPNFLLHGMEYFGARGAFRPFMPMMEAVGYFSVGLAIAACGLGLLLGCFMRLDDMGRRVVGVILFGSIGAFFWWALATNDVTLEGKVILSVVGGICTIVAVVGAVWGFDTPRPPVRYDDGEVFPPSPPRRRSATVHPFVRDRKDQKPDDKPTLH